MASPIPATRTAVPPWMPRPASRGSASQLAVLQKGSSKESFSDFYEGLSEEAGKALQKIEHTVSFPAGAIIFMEGHPARGVYILRQGRAKLLTTNSDGRTMILKIATQRSEERRVGKE